MGSIPIRSRHAASFGARRLAPLSLSLLLLLGVGVRVPPAVAQRPDAAGVRPVRTDSTPPRPPAAGADSLVPPLSPRRAFLYSTLLPGYSQSVFGRNRSAALMLLVEAMSIAMIRESVADVNEVRRFRRDSVVTSYVNASSGGAETTFVTPRFDADLLHARQSHVEDWIALLVANHLFSGAEAFVAALLWDVPAQLSVRARPGEARVGARLSW